MKSNSNKIRKIAATGVIAAVYVVLTISLSSLSYGGIQFRIAEALMLLCFYKKEYCYALTVGCLISNMFSPMPMDMAVGTAATAIAAFFMYLIGKKSENFRLLKMIIASFMPVISNGIIVGIELNVAFGEPLVISMLQVALGEFVCVTVLGVIIFRLLEKNKQFFKLIAGK